MTTKTTLPPHTKTFTVAPSPFNSIKFELGVILLVGLLLLAHGRVIGSAGLQLLLLAAYGIIGMAWLIVRTRRILLRQQTAAARHSHDEPQ